MARLNNQRVIHEVYGTVGESWWIILGGKDGSYPRKNVRCPNIISWSTSRVKVLKYYTCKIAPVNQPYELYSGLWIVKLSWSIVYPSPSTLLDKSQVDSWLNLHANWIELPSGKLTYLLKMAIEIVDLHIKNGDVPWLC